MFWQFHVSSVYTSPTELSTLKNKQDENTAHDFLTNVVWQRWNLKKNGFFKDW